MYLKATIICLRQLSLRFFRLFSKSQNLVAAVYQKKRHNKKRKVINLVNRKIKVLAKYAVSKITKFKHRKIIEGLSNSIKRHSLIEYCFFFLLF